MNIASSLYGIRDNIILALYAQGKIDGRDMVMLDAIVNQHMTKSETARILKVTRQAVSKRLVRLRPIFGNP